MEEGGAQRPSKTSGKGGRCMVEPKDDVQLSPTIIFFLGNFSFFAECECFFGSPVYRSSVQT